MPTPSGTSSTPGASSSRTPPPARGGGGSDRGRWALPREWLRRLVGWGQEPEDQHDLGLVGEKLAARELVRRGYRILEHRWRCRIGEIDLVARDGAVLVVVEVKTRTRRDYGPATDAVDGTKRLRLERLALRYLAARRLHPGSVTVRFDVVGVELVPGAPPRVRVVPNAFPARL